MIRTTELIQIDGSTFLVTFSRVMFDSVTKTATHLAENLEKIRKEKNRILSVTNFNGYETCYIVITEPLILK